MLAGLVILILYAGFAAAAVFGLLRAFFRSTHLPAAFKAEVVGLFGVLLPLLALVWSVVTSDDLSPPPPRPQPAYLTLTQPGPLSYPLGGGQIEQARYGTFPFLALSGTLPDGQLLRVRFSASPGFAPANETNVVVASVQGAKATGRSIYDPATKPSAALFCAPCPAASGWPAPSKKYRFSSNNRAVPGCLTPHDAKPTAWAFARECGRSA